MGVPTEWPQCSSHQLSRRGSTVGGGPVAARQLTAIAVSAPASQQQQRLATECSASSNLLLPLQGKDKEGKGKPEGELFSGDGLPSKPAGKSKVYAGGAASGKLKVTL